jgi:hypothetical protein
MRKLPKDWGRRNKILRGHRIKLLEEEEEEAENPQIATSKSLKDLVPGRFKVGWDGGENTQQMISRGG